MSVIKAALEDRKVHKKSKKGKERVETLEDSVMEEEKSKRKKKAINDEPGDDSTTLEGSNPVAGGKNISGHRIGKGKAKSDKTPSIITIEADTSRDQEASAQLSSQRKKRRERDVEDDVPPNKRLKKVQEEDMDERTDSKNGAPGQDHKKKKKKSEKRQKTAADTASQPQSTGHVHKSEKKKKRKNRTGFHDPEEDADSSLSSQARKALIYAFGQFYNPKEWKFNKARQNWLVRNFWVANAIPEKYENLVVKYLSAVQGNARENLVKTCRTILEETNAPPQEQKIEEAEGDGKNSIGGALIDAPPPTKPAPDGRKRTRAEALLQALTSSSDTPVFSPD